MNTNTTESNRLTESNKKSGLFKNTAFLFATLIIIFTILLSVVSYLRIYDLNFIVGNIGYPTGLVGLEHSLLQFIHQYILL